MFSRANILDPDIREALVGGCSGLHNGRNGELVIHELGLAHAKRRIDIAAIDGEFRGYEIKSEKDNLNRLDGQLQIFTRALHHLTLVVATKHLNSILGTIPAWCGVTEVRADLKDRIKLREVRKAKRNPSFDPFTFAHLLWRSEAQNLLSRFDAEPAIFRAPRAILYRLLVEKLSEDQLTKMIKDAMEKRNNWRGHSQPS